MINIPDIAEVLDSAAMNAEAVDQISKEETFTVDEAYYVQKASIDRRYRRGEKFVGLKMGFTSYAKMEQMGVHDMIWGRLTDAMQFQNQYKLDLDRYIHPRSEPEIAFLIKKEINQEISSKEDLMTYVEGVSAAIEIIDSRFQNFKFSLEDVIADNCSSTGFVVGRWCDPQLDLGKLSMKMYFNDELVREGSSEAILGDPWMALMNATRLASQYGQTIPAGSIILAGASTAAEFLKASTRVKVEVESLGEVTFSC